MILQTDPRFVVRPHIQTYGCYMLCLAFLGVKYSGWPAGIDELCKAYDDLVRMGLISETCYVYNPVSVGQHFGCPTVAVHKQGAEYEPGPDQIAIQYWTRPRPETGGVWGHFTAGDYDPMGQSRTRLEGSIDSLRVFTLG